MKKTLKNGLTIECPSLDSKLIDSTGRLHAKFQVWARFYGLTDNESLACAILGNLMKEETYFGSTENAKKIAQKGFEKLKQCKETHIILK